MTEKYHARPAGEITSEQLERDAEVIDAIGLRLARLANADPYKWAGSRAARESGDPAGAPELRRFAREAADNVACSM